ncbi:hypothetical protein QJQ45_012739 [Haematococcus lacustris]|nr:hypothetical protein QJQ45_012739 [Haematococcus lacustris]
MSKPSLHTPSSCDIASGTPTYTTPHQQSPLKPLSHGAPSEEPQPTLSERCQLSNVTGTSPLSLEGYQVEAGNASDSAERLEGKPQQRLMSALTPLCIATPGEEPTSSSLRASFDRVLLGSGHATYAVSPASIEPAADPTVWSEDSYPSVQPMPGHCSCIQLDRHAEAQALATSSQLHQPSTCHPADIPDAELWCPTSPASRHPSTSPNPHLGWSGAVSRQTAPAALHPTALPQAALWSATAISSRTSSAAPHSAAMFKLEQEVSLRGVEAVSGAVQPEASLTPQSRQRRFSVTGPSAPSPDQGSGQGFSEGLWEERQGRSAPLSPFRAPGHAGWEEGEVGGGSQPLLQVQAADASGSSSRDGRISRSAKAAAGIVLAGPKGKSRVEGSQVWHTGHEEGQLRAGLPLPARSSKSGQMPLPRMGIMGLRAAGLEGAQPCVQAAVATAVSGSLLHHQHHLELGGQQQEGTKLDHLSGASCLPPAASLPSPCHQGSPLQSATPGTMPHSSHPHSESYLLGGQQHTHPVESQQPPPGSDPAASTHSRSHPQITLASLPHVQLLAPTPSSLDLYAQQQLQQQLQPQLFWPLPHYSHVGPALVPCLPAPLAHMQLACNPSSQTLVTPALIPGHTSFNPMTTPDSSAHPPMRSQRPLPPAAYFAVTHGLSSSQRSVDPPSPDLTATSTSAAPRRYPGRGLDRGSLELSSTHLLSSTSQPSSGPQERREGWVAKDSMGDHGHAQAHAGAHGQGQDERGDWLLSAGAGVRERGKCHLPRPSELKLTLRKGLGQDKGLEAAKPGRAVDEVAQGLLGGVEVKSSGEGDPGGKVKQKGARMARVKAVLASFRPTNIQDFDKMLDPLALAFLFLFCCGLACVGCWELSRTVARDTVSDFQLDSPLRGNPYLLIAISWSFFNAIPPYIFLHYCFSAGPTFKFMTRWLPWVSLVLLLGAVSIMWMLIPEEVKAVQALSASLQNFFPNQVMTDTNTNVSLVVGLSALPLALPALLARRPADGLPLLLSPPPAAPPASAAPLDPTTTTTTLSGLTSNTSSSLDQLVLGGRKLLLAAESLANLDLTGGLQPGLEPVKYAMPAGYTLTMMAWGLLQFPEGYTLEQAAAAKQTLRRGADYLMRCNLNLDDPLNPVFVAQLGDPDQYVSSELPGYSPESAGRVWTGTLQDEALTGSSARRAWLMVRENPGADLLSNVAAALAAASMALRAEDQEWSSLALRHARYLYAFATSQPLQPQSYCATIPCTASIAVQQQVTALPIAPEVSEEPRCYWADWGTRACRAAYTTAECNDLRLHSTDVYINRQGCCDVFAASKVWAGTHTGAQGVCALPANQTTCYVPDAIQRTCYQQEVDLITGLGCNGVGLEIFSSALSCCTYLSSRGVVGTTGGQSNYGSGLCSRLGVDPGFKKCYVPSITNGTCLALSGSACLQFGAETSFDQPLGCCNRLMTLMAGAISGAFNTSGVCALAAGVRIPSPKSPPFPPRPPQPPLALSSSPDAPLAPMPPALPAPPRPRTSPSLATPPTPSPPRTTPSTTPSQTTPPAARVPAPPPPLQPPPSTAAPPTALNGTPPPASNTSTTPASSSSSSSGGSNPAPAPSAAPAPSVRVGRLRQLVEGGHAARGLQALHGALEQALGWPGRATPRGPAPSTRGSSSGSEGGASSTSGKGGSASSGVGRAGAYGSREPRLAPHGVARTVAQQLSTAQAGVMATLNLLRQPWAGRQGLQARQSAGSSSLTPSGHGGSKVTAHSPDQDMAGKGPGGGHTSHPGLGLAAPLRRLLQLLPSSTPSSTPTSAADTLLVTAATPLPASDPVLTPATQGAGVAGSSPPAASPTPQSLAAQDFALLTGQGARGAAAAAPPALLLPSPSSTDGTLRWPLPTTTNTSLPRDLCAPGAGCRKMARQRELQVGLFNSSTVLDDMAWGAAWLHKATGEAGYLGQAELFMSRHQQEEVVARSLHHTRQYYVPDWDNTAWAADMLLAAATQRPVYLSRIRKLLSTWLYAESLPTGPDLSGVQGSAPADELSRLEHFTPNGSAISFAVVPECKPTALYEVNCYDGIDDDCNGFVDRMDLAVIQYTPRQIAFSGAPSLPRTANAAFLALAYADLPEPDAAASTQMRCWALAQVGHMLGSGHGERSYVVGMGSKSPTIVQHRESSCPAPPTDPDSGASTGSSRETQSCTWNSGYYPFSPNPQLHLVTGALVSGPGLYDEFDASRTSPQTRVTTVDNAAFPGVLAGLADSGTTLRSCEGLHGVWQRYVVGENGL